MADILIRGVPDEDVERLDALAADMGISRAEFVRRQIHQEVNRHRGKVTAEDFQRFAEVFRDLGDPDIMAGAWK